jgi:hypothetical protein
MVWRGHGKLRNTAVTRRTLHRKSDYTNKICIYFDNLRAVYSGVVFAPGAGRLERHAVTVVREHEILQLSTSRRRDAQTPAMPDHSRNPDWKTGPGCRRTRGGRAPAGRCVATDSSKCRRSGIRSGGRGSQRSIRCRILSEIWFHSLHGLAAETHCSDADDCRGRQVSRLTCSVVSSSGIRWQRAGCATRDFAGPDSHPVCGVAGAMGSAGIVPASCRHRAGIVPAALPILRHALGFFLQGHATEVLAMFSGGTPENAAKMAALPEAKGQRAKDKGIKHQREQSALAASRQHPAGEYRQDQATWFRDHPQILRLSQTSRKCQFVCERIHSEKNPSSIPSSPAFGMWMKWRGYGNNCFSRY